MVLQSQEETWVIMIKSSEALSEGTGCLNRVENSIPKGIVGKQCGSWCITLKRRLVTLTQAKLQSSQQINRIRKSTAKKSLCDITDKCGGKRSCIHALGCTPSGEIGARYGADSKTPQAAHNEGGSLISTGGLSTTSNRLF